MSVEAPVDIEYIRKLEQQIAQTEVERDNAKDYAKRLRKCYNEDHQYIIDAKILKCELAECKEEIERLQKALREVKS